MEEMIEKSPRLTFLITNQFHSGCHSKNQGTSDFFQLNGKTGRQWWADSVGDTGFYNPRLLPSELGKRFSPRLTIGTTRWSLAHYVQPVRANTRNLLYCYRSAGRLREHIGPKIAIANKDVYEQF